jgi:hypothetical protein
MACDSGSEQKKCCPPEPVIVPNWQSYLQTLQQEFDGTMAILLAPMSVCPLVFGAGARAVPYIGIAFSVYRGVASGILGYYGDPTPDDQKRLQHAMFSGILAGTVVIELAMAGGPTIPISLAISGGGGLIFVALDRYGSAAYDWIEDHLDSLLKVGKYDPRQIYLLNLKCARDGICKPPPPPPHDPLILDLNGDGIKTTTVNNGVHFD